MIFHFAAMTEKAGSELSPGGSAFTLVTNFTLEMSLDESGMHTSHVPHIYMLCTY